MAPLACLCLHVIVSSASVRLQRIEVAPGATLWPKLLLLGESCVPSGTQLGPLSRMAPGSTALVLEELHRKQDTLS